MPPTVEVTVVLPHDVAVKLRALAGLVHVSMGQQLAALAAEYVVRERPAKNHARVPLQSRLCRAVRSAYRDSEAETGNASGGHDSCAEGTE